MSADPKQLVAATQKIETHLKAFEARQRVVDATLGACEERLKRVESISSSVIRDGAEHLKKVQVITQKLEALMLSLKGMKTDVKKADAEYEMIQRRYLEGKKTLKEITENYLEKLAAKDKDKNDKKAAMEYELAAKAFTKVNNDVGKLLDAAQQMVPSKYNKGIDTLIDVMPQVLDDYEKTMQGLFKAVDWQKLDKFEGIFGRLAKS